MSVTGGIMAGIGAAGAIGGSAISSNAAGNAASTQAQAAEQAAQLQYEASQNSLGFQEQEFNQEQQNLAPWLTSGAGALSNLDYLLGISPATQSPYGTSGGTQPITQQPGSTNPLRPTPPTGVNSGGAPHLNAQSQVSPVPGGNYSNTSEGMVPLNPGAPGAAPGSTYAPGYTQGYTNNGMPSGVPGVPSQATTSLNGSPNPSLGGYGSLMAAYPGGSFIAPTATQLQQNDPGYQARMQLGEQALQQSAAAGGNLLTGGTAEALNQFAQNYASNEYNNYYNQAYNTYATNYNQFEQQQTNEYNRLASLAGIGQQSASTLGTLGQNAANSVASNELGTASAIGNQLNNAGAANASGIVGSANAWGSGISGATSNLSNLALLNQIYGSGTGAADANLYGNMTQDGMGLG